MLFLSTKPVMTIKKFEAQQQDYKVEISRDYRPDSEEQKEKVVRPIFTRQDLKVDRPESKVKSEVKARPKPSSRLLGILSGAQTAAVFEVAGKARSLKAGEKLEGWVIDAIEPEKVHLSFSGEQHTMLFDETVFQKDSRSSRRSRSRFRTPGRSSGPLAGRGPSYGPPGGP